MKITKRVHLGYKEWLKIKDKNPEIRCRFGKFQYFYKTKDKLISLVNLKHYSMSGEDIWEYAYPPKRRFCHVRVIGHEYSKADAERKILKLLKHKNTQKMKGGQK